MRIEISYVIFDVFSKKMGQNLFYLMILEKHFHFVLKHVICGSIYPSNFSRIRIFLKKSDYPRGQKII